MIPLAQAQDYILGNVDALPPTKVPLSEALGLITAQDTVSPEAVPAWDNTAMDGFAVRSVDTETASTSDPVILDVSGTIAAGGRPDFTIAPGQAARIMTGAPIPPGSDAVIQVELVSQNQEGTKVEITTSVPPGCHVRRSGEDLTAGQLAVPANTLLSPAYLGVLATIGVQEIVTHPFPKVAVISTGDELVSGGGALEVGQIRDSNRISLLGLLKQTGAPVIDGGVVPDQLDAIEEAFCHFSEQADVVITTGGVSMGDFDYVKVVLDKLGDMRWMQVAIRPAKPLAFGKVGDTPVFGLPGNPVSCIVSYELFARPALLKMAGRAGSASPRAALSELVAPQLYRRRVKATATEPLKRKPDGKTHFQRVVCQYVAEDEAKHQAGYTIGSAGGQGSHQLFAMAQANGLAILEDGEGVEAGEEVDVILLEEST